MSTQPPLFVIAAILPVKLKYTLMGLVNCVVNNPVDRYPVVGDPV